MSDALHIVLHENRHRLQQSQRDTPTQRRRFRKINQVLQTETQTNSLRKLYGDIILRMLWIVVGFEGNLTIANVSLTRKFDTSLCYIDSDTLGKSAKIATNPLEF